MDSPHRSLSGANPDVRPPLVDIGNCFPPQADSPDYKSDVGTSTYGDVDGEVSSDEDNDMLQYAIMLSLQKDNANRSMKCLTNDSDSNVDTPNDLFSHAPDSLPQQHLDNMQASRLASLPLELKELICSYVFCGENIVVRPGKEDQPKLLITWGSHLSVLLLSKEFNAIATRFLGSGEVILDLRQFRVRNTTTRANLGSHIHLDSLLSAAVSLRSVCSKLMLRQGQLIHCSDIETLLPSLTHVEMFNYKTCREALRESGLSPGRIFEYAMPISIRAQATSDLSELQRDLPSSICADLVYVCDTLVCIPKHVPEDNNVKSVTGDGVEDVLKFMRNAFQSGHESMRIGKTEKERDESRPSPRYKTAKQRHLILFNNTNPEGLWLSKEWVVAGLSVQSLSLGDILAIHCHEYCLELIERGETVGI